MYIHHRTQLDTFDQLRQRPGTIRTTAKSLLLFISGRVPHWLTLNSTLLLHLLPFSQTKILNSFSLSVHPANQSLLSDLRAIYNSRKSTSCLPFAALLFSSPSYSSFLPILLFLFTILLLFSLPFSFLRILILRSTAPSLHISPIDRLYLTTLKIHRSRTPLFRDVCHKRQYDTICFYS
ncbi:hypothetical protein BKA57DRAFT_456963 [Linnemannia elongata]|nr:hypothetical protein BKA57DRAFT_456963 [Linnemannia elongata]